MFPVAGHRRVDVRSSRKSVGRQGRCPEGQTNVDEIVLCWCSGLRSSPRPSSAQASITGVVKDTSGVVLPGVTVEVSSDGTDREGSLGAHRHDRAVSESSICGPARDTLTFTLSGFSSLKREGLELTGSFIATVNADLRVGGLDETITVTGETPMVDVQSATEQRVFERGDYRGDSDAAAASTTCGVLIQGCVGLRADRMSAARRDWTPPLR